MVLFLPMPNLRAGLETWLAGLKRSRKTRPVPDATPETRRAERDLIEEVIWSHPDAFSSGLDIEYMVRMTRGRR
ncbi:MAG: hypothetical protein KDK29_15390 [Sedimentitalea sp.]|nr:hypothetical protein [Sedimentitalea sp.]